MVVDIQRESVDKFLAMINTLIYCIFYVEICITLLHRPYIPRFGTSLLTIASL